MSILDLQARVTLLESTYTKKMMLMHKYEVKVLLIVC